LPQIAVAVNLRNGGLVLLVAVVSGLRLEPSVEPESEHT
jgi:hypothetical protein